MTIIHSVMDWVNQKHVSDETILYLFERLATKVNQINKKRTVKAIKKLKEGLNVWFYDRDGFKHTGRITKIHKGVDLSEVTVINRKDKEVVYKVSPHLLNVMEEENDE